MKIVLVAENIEDLYKQYTAYEPPQQEPQKSTALISNTNIEGDLMKNIRKRSDGRYEWRKQINHIHYQKINKNLKVLEKEVRNILKLIKPTTNVIKHCSFMELANEWCELTKKGIKTYRHYVGILKNRFANNSIFSQDIASITYQQLEFFLANIKEHRTASYCYFVIKGVFTEAYKRDLIKKNIVEFVTKPKNKSVKGTQFTFAEQKLILTHLDESGMGKEILFYLLTGCRRNEAYDVKIDFEQLTIFINGTKTASSKRFVPISKKYAEILKKEFSTMFKRNDRYYNEKFKQFMEKLQIENKSIHTLRHTFSTNLYYLGVPDKQRQSYMGHSSIVVTNDIYTHLEPNLKKANLLNLYKDLYPEF